MSRVQSLISFKTTLCIPILLHNQSVRRKSHFYEYLRTCFFSMTTLLISHQSPTGVRLTFPLSLPLRYIFGNVCPLKLAINMYRTSKSSKIKVKKNKNEKKNERQMKFRRRGESKDEWRAVEGRVRDCEDHVSFVVIPYERFVFLRFCSNLRKFLSNCLFFSSEVRGNEGPFFAPGGGAFGVHCDST